MNRQASSIILAAVLIVLPALHVRCSDDEPAPPVPPDIAGRPYIGSRGSDVVHRADCVMVRRIKPSNLVAWDLLANALAEGRRGCKKCLRSATQPTTGETP